MNGYLEKTDNSRYCLTPLGRRAYEALEMVKQSATSDPDVAKYLRRQIRKSPFVTLVRSMTCILLVGVVIPVFFISKTIIDYLAAPVDWTYLLFKLLAVGMGTSLIIWLLVALRQAPDFASRVEKKLYG